MFWLTRSRLSRVGAAAPEMSGRLGEWAAAQAHA
jgi:hypothetical protein